MTTEKPKRGRPSKQALAEVKSRSVGRPKGTTAIINDYRDRMLMSPKSVKVLESIFDAALTEGHPHQASAWKLVIDRIAPVSSFDVSKNSGGAMPQISINITGLNSPKSEVETIDDITDIN